MLFFPLGFCGVGGHVLILPLLVFPVTLVFLWGPLHLGPFQLLDLELNPGLGALA